MNIRCGGKTQSQFVWGAVDGPNCYCRFLQEFTADAEEQLSLHISADSNYTVWLNGRYIGAGQYADYPQLRVYDTYDVTDAAVPGRNRLAVLGYSYNESNSVYRKNTPSVIFSISAGETEICCSGEQTLWATAPAYLGGEDCEKFSAQLTYGFAFDATKNDAWIDPEYHCGTNWKPCVPLEIACELTRRPIERLTVQEPMPAKIIAQGIVIENPAVPSRARRMQEAALCAREWRALTPEGTAKTLPDETGIRLNGGGQSVYVVIDLGRETSGWLSLDLSADYGTRIDIGFGEHLEDLRVRSYVGGRCFAVGYTATQGRQQFVHRMKRLGCRYLQLHIHGSATLYYAGILPTVYPVEEKGQIFLGDRLHERIYRTCLDTMRLCMHEHYEDCPWREQALYAMDSRNQMLFGYYAFGETRFAQSSLRLLAMGLREDGLLELCAPAEVPITIPSFTLHFVSAVWENLLFCGDRTFAHEMLPTVLRILEAFEQRVQANGLVKRFAGKEYWNFYEWSDGQDGSLGHDDGGKTFDLPLNAFFSMALQAGYMLCCEFGDDHARRFLQLRQKVNAAICECFWDRAASLFCTYFDGQRKFHLSELSQALAVCCGAADEAKQSTVLPMLASRNGALVPVTLSYSIFKYDALMTHPAVYGKRIFDEVAEIWGGMLFKGATSFWETLKGAADFDDAGSLCHGWSAVPVYLYYRYALGVYPALSGFAGYKFAPVDCGFAVRGRIAAGKKEFSVAPDATGTLTLTISENH